MAVAMAAQQRPATVNGRTVSQAELDAIIKLAPAEVRPVISKDPQELLRYYGVVDRLATMAEKDGLANESPLKEELALARMQLLATATSGRYFNEHPVSAADEQQYYAAHIDVFTSARVKGAKPPAGSSAASPGADFDALAAKYPNHDFADVIGKTDANVPEAIRTAIFELKPGGVTKPIALPGGVYLFRLEGVDVKPLDEVRGQISQRVGNERFLQWMADIRKSVTVEPAGR
ncbi:MAG: peptidyl-prolyl cis-trans isomerase [Acidobacteria bacterium]|nr:peptidyl-prolyl cis-trans isomerase [Acidobacteriota bacterium]